VFAFAVLYVQFVNQMVNCYKLCLLMHWWYGVLFLCMFTMVINFTMFCILLKSNCY